MPHQSGDTSARRGPHAAQTKRRAPAMAGNGVFGARPIAAKAMGVDRKQTGFEHVTHVPADALGLKIGDCGRGGTGCKL